MQNLKPCEHAVTSSTVAEGKYKVHKIYSKFVFSQIIHIETLIITINNLRTIERIDLLGLFLIINNELQWGEFGYHVDYKNYKL